MFDQFSIYDVMSIVGLNFSGIRSASGYFDCPICGGKNKFNINPAVGYGGVCRCAKCAAGGDKLDLYLLYRMNPSLVQTVGVSGKGGVYYRPSEKDRHDGMMRLEQELHLSRSTPGYLGKINKAQREATEAAKNRPQIAAPAVRNAVYTALLRLLRLTTPHREALRARGLTDAEIENAMFRSTPMFGRTQLAQQLIAQGLCLENVPGFFLSGRVEESTGELMQEWSIYCPQAGYFVPIRDKEGNIVSMQIRLNKATTSHDKYRFFSSVRENLTGGTAAVSEVHVEMCAEAPRYLYITEGAIKGHVAHALYKRLCGRDDIIILCVAGTSNFGGVTGLLEGLLEKYNIQSVIEFYDLDKFTNQYVMRDRANLENEINKTIIKLKEKLAYQYKAGKSKPAYASFPQDAYYGKGIDDHLLAFYNQNMCARAPIPASSAQSNLSA